MLTSAFVLLNEKKKLTQSKSSRLLQSVAFLVGFDTCYITISCLKLQKVTTSVIANLLINKLKKKKKKKKKNDQIHFKNLAAMALL